jgi:hypothetical protein
MHARAFDELSRFMTAFSRRRSLRSPNDYLFAYLFLQQEEDCRYRFGLEAGLTSVRRKLPSQVARQYIMTRMNGISILQSWKEAQTPGQAHTKVIVSGLAAV